MGQVVQLRAVAYSSIFNEQVKADVFNDAPVKRYRTESSTKPNISSEWLARDHS